MSEEMCPKGGATCMRLCDGGATAAAFCWGLGPGSGSGRFPCEVDFVGEVDGNDGEFAEPVVLRRPATRES